MPKQYSNDLDRPGNLLRAPDMPADAGLRALLGQIRARQQSELDAIHNLTPEKLGFRLMRTIPRSNWHKTWPEVAPGVYKRGQTDPGYAANFPFNIWSPGLKKLTPAHLIKQMFDAQTLINSRNSPSPY